jgi:hypothetical protein
MATDGSGLVSLVQALHLKTRVTRKEDVRFAELFTLFDQLAVAFLLGFSSNFYKNYGRVAAQPTQRN